MGRWRENRCTMLCDFVFNRFAPLSPDSFIFDAAFGSHNVVAMIGVRK